MTRHARSPVDDEDDAPDTGMVAHMFAALIGLLVLVSSIGGILRARRGLRVGFVVVCVIAGFVLATTAFSAVEPEARAALFA